MCPSVSVSVQTFQTEQHHVREQPGSPHCSVGTHSSHPLHQHCAGDGRLQHHHYWLPRWADLSLGHDPRAGGSDEHEGCDDCSCHLVFISAASLLLCACLLCLDLSSGHVVWSHRLHHLSVQGQCLQRQAVYSQFLRERVSMVGPRLAALGDVSILTAVIIRNFWRPLIQKK